MDIDVTLKKCSYNDESTGDGRNQVEVTTVPESPLRQRTTTPANHLCLRPRGQELHKEEDPKKGRWHGEHLLPEAENLVEVCEVPY
jgi:hypothetical protein